MNISFTFFSDDSVSNELPQVNQHLHIPNFAERAEIAERYGLLGLDENDEEIDEENNEDLNEIVKELN